MLDSLQSRRNFGERVLGTFLMKIMAALFDFNQWHQKAGERRKFVAWGKSTVKNKERGGAGKVKIPFCPSPTPYPHRPL